MAFADTQELAVRLSLKDNFSRGIGNAARALKGFDKATSNTQRSLGKFGSNIQRGVALGLTATTAGFVGVVKAAADYESAFAGVRKTVTATEPELQKLSDAFRQMAKEIPISAAELARLGEAGGALGIAATDLQEFVRVTALLGETTDLTADEAANSLGILSNVLHLTGEEYDNFASSLVALGNAGASTESQIIAIAERAGATGELVGFGTSQILGFSSAIASLGIEAEAGGTALQKFLIDSTKFAAKGGDELRIMAKVAGTSAKAFKKAMDKDAGAALQRFLAGLGELDQATQLGILEDLGFNDARITRTLLGLANNTELVASQMEIANSAFEENTALTKEAEQRFKTFDSQLQITKNVLTDIGITIGSKLLPKLVPLLQKLNSFVSDHQADIEQFGTDFAAGFEKFADAIGKVDWQPFIDGLRFTADVAKGAIAAFQSMPDWLQKLIVAGAVTNKITGGLLTSIGKDLAGTAFHFALDRGSSPANPLFVSAVGGLGGGVTPVGKPGAAGTLATAAKFLPLVLTGALLAGAAEAVAPIFREALDLPEGGLPENTVVQRGPLLVGSDAAQARARMGAPPESAFIKKVGGPLSQMVGGIDAIVRNTASGERKEAIISQTAMLHEANRLSHDQLKAFRDGKLEQSDLASIPRLLQFYGSATRINEQSIATDIASLKNLESIALERGDTVTAAKIAAAIVQLTATQKAAEIAAAEKIALASKAAGQQAAFAIRDKDLSVTVPVTVNTSVSLRETIRTQTTFKQYYKTAS